MIKNNINDDNELFSGFISNAMVAASTISRYQIMRCQLKAAFLFIRIINKKQKYEKKAIENCIPEKLTATFCNTIKLNIVSHTIQ